MGKILKFTILIVLISDIAFEIYQHNVDAAIAYFIALIWFGVAWHYESLKSTVVNIFIENDDKEEDTIAKEASKIDTL